MRIYGIDFTCAPRPAKPITCAVCDLQDARLTLLRVRRFTGFAAFERLLASSGPWVGGFDFPFGQPRELLTGLRLPTDWPDCCNAVASMPGDAWRAQLAAFRNARPAGRKEPPRATDVAAGAQSAMKSVNPPVALMYRTGAPRLMAAGLDIVPCRRNTDSRSAIETYPGLLARRLIGRASYKSDDRHRQNRERAANRRRLIAALPNRLCRPLGLQLACSASQLRTLAADPSGDRLDALLCAIHAAWAWRQPAFGMPERVDTLEGWIPVPW
jgi:hypothetical protein